MELNIQNIPTGLWYRKGFNVVSINIIWIFMWINIDWELNPKYLAGFFDGEGSVTISKQTSRWYVLQLSINQKKSDILKIIQKQYGGYLYFDRRNGCSYLHITANKAEKFLKDIFPYSVVKREQIKMALIFCYIIRKNYRKQTIPEELIDLREKIRLKMIEMNEYVSN